MHRALGSRMKATDSWAQVRVVETPGGSRPRVRRSFDLDDEGGEGGEGGDTDVAYQPLPSGSNPGVSRDGRPSVGRVLTFVGTEAPPASATPNATENPAALRGDATLGIEPGSVPSTMDVLGVPTTGEHALAERGGSRLAAANDPADRAVAPRAQGFVSRRRGIGRRRRRHRGRSRRRRTRPVRRLGRSRGDVAVAFAFALAFAREASAEFFGSRRRDGGVVVRVRVRTSADAG